MHLKNKERLWIFDFDGTLSTIVADRSKAAIHPDCQELIYEFTENRYQQVAILSSRMLEDLYCRVRIPGIFLGGSSGMEWITPDGKSLHPEEKLTLKLFSKRGAVIPEIEALRSIPGLEVEDKKWSFTFHFRKASPESKKKIALQLKRLEIVFDIKMYYGPEAIEIQFLPEINKAFGVKTLCKRLRFKPSPGNIIFSGDDENDAIAMQWVLQHGGIAFTVGDSPLVHGSRIVDGPASLAQELCKLRQEQDKGYSAEVYR